MKKWSAIIVVIFLLLICSPKFADAQCSICTKTASQLGEKPARGMNAGILYLMFAPLAIAGFIGIRWWKREKMVTQGESSDI